MPEKSKEQDPNSVLPLRARSFLLLESSEHPSVLSKIVNLFLIVLIISNVAAVIIESEPSIGGKYRDLFSAFEILSVSIFSIEYMLRIWACVEAKKVKNRSNFKSRVAYIFSPMALVDLIAILPFFITLITSIDLRLLRLLRVLRLMKLTHYFKGFNIFISVITKELKSIAAATIVMVFLIIIAASLMYTIEGEAQPEVFGNILHSLWWAVVTITTVGYGDVTPVTLAGKVVATFIMLIGVALVALPAGILAARFGDELRERKRNLYAHVEQALQDNIINDREYVALKELAEHLELRPEDLERHIALIKELHHDKKCPHCGKLKRPLDKS